RLTEVGVADRLVHIPVEELNTRAVSRVPRVHGTNLITPLLSRLLRVAVGTVAAPLVARIVAVGPTPRGDTRSRRPRLEDIGIEGHQRLRHHRSRRAAEGVHALRVTVVLLEHVLHHLRDGVGVATTVAGEALRRAHVPAVPARGFWKDDDEPVLVGRGTDVADAVH